MSGALRREALTGMVRVETGRCRGCWMCIMACPFGAIQADRVAGVAHKCDGCSGQVTAACVAACAPGALILGEEAAVEQTKRRGRSLRSRLEDR
jgi:carbon-monoxide dehydrogenase iron sulfur subunit